MDLEPWGEERADLRMGISAASNFNIHRGKARARRAKDFMPDFQPKPKDSRSLMDKLKDLTAAVVAHRKATKAD